MDYFPGAVSGLAQPVGPFGYSDFALVVLALEVDGRRIFVAEMEPFEGFSDMPFARAAVRKANIRALARVREQARGVAGLFRETPNKAPEPTPGLVTPRATAGGNSSASFREARGAPSPIVAHL